MTRAMGQHMMNFSFVCAAVLQGSSGKGTWLLPAAAASSLDNGGNSCLFCLSAILPNTSTLH